MQLEHINTGDFVCDARSPFGLKGQVIGHVITRNGERLYVVQCLDGEIPFFIGTRTSLAKLRRVA